MNYTDEEWIPDVLRGCERKGLTVVERGKSDLPWRYRHCYLNAAKDLDCGELRVVGWFRTNRPDNHDNDLFLEVAYKESKDTYGAGYGCNTATMSATCYVN